MVSWSRPRAPALLCGVVAVLSSGPAPCLAAPMPPGAGPGTAVSPVRQLEAAIDIAALGRATGDPVLLLAAARVVIASQADHPVPGPDLAKATANTDSKDPWSADVLLAEARTLAGTNAGLQASIRETANGAHRGVLSGPSQIHEVILPGQVQRFRFVFAARELADAAVRLKPGSQGAALGVEAIDDHGRRVTAPTPPARIEHAAYIAWFPRHCAAYTIIVRNTRDTPAAYRLATAPSKRGMAGCRAAPARAVRHDTGARK